MRAALWLLVTCVWLSSLIEIGFGFRLSILRKRLTLRFLNFNAQKSHMEDDNDREKVRQQGAGEFTDGFLHSQGVIFSSDFRSAKSRRGKLISSRDRRRERMIYSRGPRYADESGDTENFTQALYNHNTSDIVEGERRRIIRLTEKSSGIGTERGFDSGKDTAHNNGSFLVTSIVNNSSNYKSKQYKSISSKNLHENNRARTRDLGQMPLPRGNPSTTQLTQKAYTISGKQTTLHANDVYCRFLQYDHLSSHSFDTIEVSPNRVPRQKSIAYVSRWWHGARKWGVLSDELLQLGREFGCDQDIEDRMYPSVNQSFSVPLISREFYEAVRAHCGRYKARVICVGDVHGCADELRDLLYKVRYRPCDVVILLGDLVAKGPRSIDVIQMAMDLNAVSVRGNHDQEVIRRSVTWRTSRNVRSTEKTKHNEHTRIAKELTPAQWSWLTELPYFVRSDDLSALFVHAGFQANLRLTDQDPWVMMTMRSLLPGYRASARCDSRFPWASLWKGPMTVYFGHDAARGLQVYNHAVGLDTGCVYGAELTSMILPDKEIVAVRARAPYQDMKKSRSHKSLAATDPYASDATLDRGAQSSTARAY